LKGVFFLRKRKSYKVLSSLVALMLVFSLFAPSFVGATTKEEMMKKGSDDTNAMLEMRSGINEQLELSSQGPTLHESLKDATGLVNVIVHFSEHPVALVKGMKEVEGKTFSKAEAATVTKKIKTQQDYFINQLSNQKLSYKQGYAFQTVLNGMGLTIDASQLPELLKIKGVTLIEPDQEMVALGQASSATETSMPSSTTNDVEANMATSISHLGVEKLWDAGYEGEGVKVGVIDTGIDYNHPEFEGVYKGGKNFVPHVSTSEYTTTRAADDPYETSPNERPATKPEFNTNGSSFYTSHGTHVAGTIAAQGKNENGIKGIAPNVELYAYRVLGAYGSGQTTWIIAGVEEAIKAGMDVINLSLGSTVNDANAANSLAVNNAMLAGVVTVVATGNAGANGRGSIGSPSAASMVISVGNATNPETTRKATVSVNTTSGYTKEAQLNMMSWTYGQDPSQTLAGEYDLVAVPGVGKPTDYAGLDVTDKVVLVARGEIAFVDKIAAAKAAGAKGLLIHNSQSGAGAPGPTNTFLSDAFAYLPAFDMSYTDGNALRSALGTKAGKVTFSDYVVGKTAGDEMNSSSSQGPAKPNFDIKPDVVAPGTNIMSSVAAYGKHDPNADYEVAYERYTGTSMATPHIAGISALLVDMHPEWTPFDVKVALSNTAQRLDTTKYDVFLQGPGRVQPEKAAWTKALARVEGVTKMDNVDHSHTRGTISFGQVMSNANNVVTATKDIVVENLGTTADEYTVDVTVTKNATGSMAGAKVSVDQPSFTLDSEQVVKVSLELPAGESSYGNEILGYVTIKSAGTTLSLPFAADISPPLGVKNHQLQSYHISPDGDGVKESTLLNYEFYEEQTLTYVKVWDVINYTGGQKGDGYLGDFFYSSTTSIGPKQIAISDKYEEVVGTSVVKKTAPDGVYTADLYARSKVTGLQSSDWDGPLFIKKSDPVNQANVKLSVTNSLTGKVVDKYVDWKAPVEFMFGPGYIVNDYYTAQYEVINKDYKTVKKGSFTIADDGTYSIDLSAYKDEQVWVKIIIVDAAGNSVTNFYSVVGDDVLPSGEVVDPYAFDYTKPMKPVPTEPIPTTNPTLTVFGLDNSAISPNGDGNRDQATLSYQYRNIGSGFTTIYVFDVLKPKSGKASDGILGDVFFSTYRGGLQTTPFTGKYTTNTDFKTYQLPDGAYEFRFNRPTQASVGPVFIKSSKPEITAPTEATVQGKTYTFEGSVADKFIDWKAAVETQYNKEYDVNTYLQLGYVLKDKDGLVVDSKRIHLNGDGSFTASIQDLAKGEYTVALIARDIAHNEVSQDLKLTVEEEVVVPEPEPVDPGTGYLAKGDIPLANITFSLYSLGEQAWYDLTTDGEGKFNHELPDGEYKLEGVWVAPTWYLLNKTFTITDGLVDGKTAFTIDVLDYQIPVDTTKWNVYGNLVNGSNSLTDIPFSIEKLDDNSWYSARTDSTGKFAYNLSDGTYRIHGIWLEQKGKWFELNQEFTVKDGNLEGLDTLLIDIQTAANLDNVTGTLTKGTKTLANVMFSLRTAEGEVTWYDIKTDANGNFGVKLPDGAYIIEGVWIGSEYRWYVLHQEVTVSGSAVVTIDVTQGPAETQPNVTGLLTHDGVAVPHIIFSVESSTGEWYNTVTDEIGSFDFKLPDGSYTLHGIWLESNMTWYPMTLQFTVVDGKLVGGDLLTVNF
jgi:minor extracellular serine protease Vpr